MLEICTKLFIQLKYLLSSKLRDIHAEPNFFLQSPHFLDNAPFIFCLFYFFENIAYFSKSFFLSMLAHVFYLASVFVYFFLLFLFITNDTIAPCLFSLFFTSVCFFFVWCTTYTCSTVYNFVTL